MQSDQKGSAAGSRDIPASLREIYEQTMRGGDNHPSCLGVSLSCPKSKSSSSRSSSSESELDEGKVLKLKEHLKKKIKI